ncbi:hypothetical protein [Accumulibacter sp.]|jgi:hypothetical protein|uniref:hypothetical protein n=1 Tax=Accumulibacter sp. TaxID=2053492 RepID=UPI002D1FBA76|nr:hypothetical protein [Accumulibacter sp.]
MCAMQPGPPPTSVDSSWRHGRVGDACGNLMHACGGTLAVDGQPGQGVRFDIVLPNVAPAAASPPGGDGH